MYISVRIRIINNKQIGLHSTEDLESLNKDELIELVEELVSDLDDLELELSEVKTND